MDPSHVKEKEGEGEEEERVGEREEEEEEEITASKLRAKPRCLPISAVPAFSYIPPRRQDPKEHSYFQRESQTGIISLYDCVFKRRLDYNQQLHRDDREHAKSLGLHVNDEATEQCRKNKVRRCFQQTRVLACLHTEPCYLHLDTQVFSKSPPCGTQLCWDLPSVLQREEFSGIGCKGRNRKGPFQC
ncbi:uncharacterized protein C5orf49 homolog isoform X1 [Peromyscus californicus insignis]|uniref:uncharacterized protein C5orf49 homolog isoform X1 n=1 Tax=Peromyscus californicus insignis TaxID=564181 RepID=UPI0022A74A4D|nr:uncharacterized protein C5orf49 homolog isoform X1 [Peromyscus californicus insignis]